MGYVILYKGSGKVGKLIGDHQRSIGLSEEACGYSHVEILGGGPYSVRTNPPMTKIVEFVNEHKGREYIVLKCLREDFDRKRYKIAFWSSSLCNLKYDFKGIAKFKLKKLIWHDSDKYFCSENVCWSYQKEYKDFMGGISPHKVTPGHFYDSIEFEEVFSGKIPEQTKKVDSKDIQNKTGFKDPEWRKI